VLFLIPSQVFAQEDEQFDSATDISSFQQWTVEERKQRLGDIIEVPLENQEKIIFEIERNSDVKVKHVLAKNEFWAANEPRMIKVLPGVHSNLYVTDKDDDLYAYFWEDETFEESQYVVLQQKLQGFELFVEYELENYLENVDGIFEKRFDFPIDIELIFEEGIDVVYINSRPIDVTNSDGINCVGCQMEFSILEKKEFSSKKISVDGTDEEIKIWSNGNIMDFGFNDELKAIYFKTEKNQQLITLEIPLDVILYPFEVYFTENEDTTLDQEDKIRNSEFSHNEKFVKLSFRPENVGNISIIGASLDVHESAASKMMPKPIEPDGWKEVEQEIIEEEIPVENLYENWGGTDSDVQDNTLIFVIIGIVSAIIIGIIVKLKKN